VLEVTFFPWNCYSFISPADPLLPWPLSTLGSGLFRCPFFFSSPLPPKQPPVFPLGSSPCTHPVQSLRFSKPRRYCTSPFQRRFFSLELTPSHRHLPDFPSFSLLLFLSVNVPCPLNISKEKPAPFHSPICLVLTGVLFHLSNFFPSRCRGTSPSPLFP